MKPPSASLRALLLVLYLFGLSSATAATPARGQVSAPFLAEDVNPHNGDFFRSSSYPAGFAEWQGSLFFVGVDTHEDLVLYRKERDEPSQPLDVLTDVPGYSVSDAIHECHVTARHLFVLVNDNRSSFAKWEQLWVSEGTVGGATLLADGLAIDTAWTAGDHLFFLSQAEVDPSTIGLDLWVSDGTLAGTRRLHGNVQSPHGKYLPYLATPFGGGLVYASRLDLWRTDGTEVTKWLDLGDIGLTDPKDLHAVGSQIYFSAVQDERRAMFLSDGTAEGTRRVSPRSAFVGVSVGLLGHRLIYTGFGGLWAAGFTEADTRQLGPYFPDWFSRPLFAILGGEMWLITDFDDLVRTDGTSQGTRLVEDFDGVVDQVFELPGHVLLVSRSEMYVADGSFRPIRRLADFESLGRQLATVENRAYFAAQGERDSGTGVELWAIDAAASEPPPPPSPPPPPPPQGDLLRPGNVQAEGGPNTIRLRWNDTSANETRFVIQMKSWEAGAVFEEVLVVPADTFSAELSFLQSILGPVLIRVRAENTQGVSPWSEVVAATQVESFFTTCGDNPFEHRILCLHDRRFGVEVYWREEASGKSGRGTPLPFDFSDDSGAFWFFDESNVELVVKVLDARVINGSFWSFFGALSNVEYWVVVWDTQNQTNVTYYNPPREICGQADTESFPRPLLLRAFQGPDTGPSRRSPASPPERKAEALEGGACTPDADTLCLTPDRYRVTVQWRDQRSGDSGVGHAIPGTSDSGYFWFFDPANVELVVKVLDARVVNGFVWVFFGALTDVEYTLTVTDTATGESKQYFNPPGNICGQADVTAFEGP